MRIRILAILTLVAGCAGPEPHPLDPAKLEAEFRARRLDDPEFLAWLHAQGVRTDAAWTVDTLTLAAFYYHPDLDVSRARLLGARGVEAAAGEIPNPTLGLDVEKVLGSTPAGVSPWVYGFSLQMPLDFLWKRGYRIDEAQARIQGARLELAEAAWQARRRIRAALLDDVLVRRDVTLKIRDLALRSEGAAAAELLLNSGEASRLEADRARIDQSAAGLLLQESRGRVESVRAALASAIGVPAAALQDAAFDWGSIDAPPELPDGIQEIGLLNRLDVLRALADYAAAEAVLGLELAKRYPDVTLGPGYLFDQGDRKFTLGLSVSLPVFNQNGGAIQVAEARRQEAAARFLAVQAKAIGDFEEASARYRAGLAQLRLTAALLAAVDRRLESVRRSVELGETDRVTLLGVQIERATLDSARLEALRRAQEALGALEDAVQRPIDGSVRPVSIPETPPRPAKESR